MKHPSLSRRRFIAQFAGGTCVLLLGAGCSGPDDQVLADKLSSFLDEKPLAINVGKVFLQANKTEPPLSLQNILDVLLSKLELSRKELANLPDNSLQERLASRIELDFVEERVQRLKGWVLSETEALMCGLLILLNPKKV